jgi:hypothetical protein
MSRLNVEKSYYYSVRKHLPFRLVSETAETEMLV